MMAASLTQGITDMPTAFISGANRGLGLELTRQYLEQGWSVISASRGSSSELDELSKQPRLETYRLDLTDDTALSDFAAGIRDRKIDVLLNNAGTMGRNSFAEHGLETGRFGSFDRSEWHEILDVNLCTPMHLAELLVDQVAASERGRIITISSMLGSMGLNTVGGLYAYRASKAAVNAIMKSMAIDLSPRGITAIALHPGYVRTDMSGPMAEIDPADSAAGMIRVIDDLTLEDSGKILAWDGSELPW